MSHEWNHEFVDGNVRMACSICGVPYRFPDEIRKCSDGLFRCLRTCDERPIRDRDKLIAQSHKRKEVPPPKFGVKPGQDTPGSLAYSCAGGVADATAMTLRIPSIAFDWSYPGRTVTIAGAVDSNNNAAHIVTAFLGNHTVRVAGSLADEAFPSSATAVIS